jgi:hypothetical protein
MVKFLLKNNFKTNLNTNNADHSHIGHEVTEDDLSSFIAELILGFLTFKFLVVLKKIYNLLILYILVEIINVWDFMVLYITF